VFTQTLDHLLRDYGYGVVGLIVCLEAMGIPAPGESLLIAASIYAATTGHLSLGWVIVSAAAGAIVGDNLGYMIGRWAGFPLLRRYGRYVGMTEKRMTLAHYLFEQHGGKVVFTGRFIAFLRTFVALMAGASRMDWKVFLLWNAVGGVVWTSVYCTGAYLLGDQMRRIEGPVGIVLGVVAAVVIVSAVVFLRRNEKKLEAKAEQSMQGKRPAEGLRRCQARRGVSPRGRIL
jgi:membrane protein DedA with SNARE-associated domain